MNPAAGTLVFKQASFLFAHQQERAASGREWLTGVKSIDAQLKNTFASGKIIGIACRADDDSTTVCVPCERRSYLEIRGTTNKPHQTLSTHLVSTHLAAISEQATESSQPSVYIISPPSTQTMLSIAALLDQKLQARPAESTPDSAALLSRIQVQQYLSLAGLIESIGDVSSSLHENTSTKNTSRQSPSPTILLLQGLSPALSATSRRSGSTQTATFATNILRSLIHLSRTYAHLLILVELDFEVRGSTTTASDPARAAGPAATPAAHSSRRVHDEALLASAFSSLHGHTISFLPSATAVSGALDSGIDVLVAVHDASGRTRAHDKQEARKGHERIKTSVVEVLKDRTGDKTGEWCLWTQ